MRMFQTNNDNNIIMCAYSLSFVQITEASALCKYNLLQPRDILACSNTIVHACKHVSQIINNMYRCDSICFRQVRIGYIANIVDHHVYRKGRI